MIKSKIMAFAVLGMAFIGFSKPADASVVTYDLSLTHDSVSTYSGTGTLILDRSVATSGVDNVSLSDVTALSFTIDGHTFSLGTPIFTVSAIQFIDGQLSAIVALALSPDYYVSLSTSTVFQYYDAHTGHGSTGTLTGALEVTTAVPEPSTWAMMILGFFGVGFLAYRRRSETPAFTAA